MRGAATQRDFSNEVGLGNNTWSRYEIDERLPDWETVQTLIGKGWNAHWIMTGEGLERDLCGSKGETLATPLQSLQAVAIDLQRLSDAIEAVETGLDATNQMMEPADKAALIAAVYELLAEQNSTAKIFRLIAKGKV